MKIGTLKTALFAAVQLESVESCEIAKMSKPLVKVSQAEIEKVRINRYFFCCQSGHPF